MRFVFFQSTSPLESWVSQYLRSSASLAKLGSFLSWLFTMASFFPVAGGNNADFGIVVTESGSNDGQDRRN